MSDGGSPRKYAGESAATRVNARRERLLAAARTVIRRDGLSRTTYRAILAESGLTGRYFYESFLNHEALVTELMAEFVALTQRTVMEAQEQAGPSVTAQAEAGIRAFVELLDQDRLHAELLLSEAPDLPVLTSLRQAGLTLFGELHFAHASQLFRPPKSQQEEWRARHAIALLNGGFLEVLRQRADGRLPLPADEFVDYTADLFLAIADHLTRSR